MAIENTGWGVIATIAESDAPEIIIDSETIGANDIDKKSKLIKRLSNKHKKTILSIDAIFFFSNYEGKVIINYSTDFQAEEVKELLKEKSELVREALVKQERLSLKNCKEIYN